MSRDIAPFGLRMPPDLKDKIEAAAHANGRSMNAEVIARLQRSFGEGVAGTHMTTESNPRLDPPAYQITPPDPTKLDQVIEAASEKGAERVMERMLASLKAVSPPSGDASRTSYLEYAMRVILGVDEKGEPVPPRKSRTPSIPGVNAPKRGIGKASSTPKEPTPKSVVRKKRVLAEKPPEGSPDPESEKGKSKDWGTW